MKTFKDLSIEGNDLKKFVDTFEKFVNDTFEEAWTIVKEEEVFFIDNCYEEASVCLVFKDYETKKKIEVTNVMPTNKKALSIERYNDVLEKFKTQVLERFKESKNLDLEIQLTDGDISLSEVFGRKALNSLKHFFSDIIEMPFEEIKEYCSSINDWYNFILYSYIEGTICFNKEEVKEYFSELLQDGQKAEFFATEYERMLSFLSYYENEFRFENRG